MSNANEQILAKRELIGYNTTMNWWIRLKEFAHGIWITFLIHFIPDLHPAPNPTPDEPEGNDEPDN